MHQQLQAITGVLAIMLGSGETGTGRGPCLQGAHGLAGDMARSSTGQQTQ